MGLSEEVVIKYNAFTLCYSKLLAHWDELRSALWRDKRGLQESIVSQFDQALQKGVYASKPKDLGKALAILMPRLTSEMKRIETMEPKAAAIIGDIMADIEQDASDWHHRSDVEAYKQWGETSSKLFYEGTPWPKTQSRLAIEANLVFQYAGFLATEVPGRNTYGYKVAPMAYYAQYPKAESGEPEENVMVVRFAFEHTFSTYLAYPFFFLHEHASHVHGADSDSDNFDDGWMMYAIYIFLSSLPPAHRLKNAQWQATCEHCPANLSTDLLRSCYLLAQDLHQWLLGDPLFREITWELAGYSLTKDNRYLHADLMRRLRYYSHKHPSELKRILAVYTSVDELLAHLPIP